MHVYEGASIFDPVLCELLYKWFCTNGGSVLDPFAGGLSVRGVVGNTWLSLQWNWFKIGPSRANKQATLLSLEDVKYAGDSNEVLMKLSSKKLIFLWAVLHLRPWKIQWWSKDLSNMDYTDFKEVYFNN
jgi:hypothetical protein